MRRILTLTVYGLAVLALVFGAVAVPSQAADHLDAPAVKKDGRLDINDVYVFHPGAPGSQDLSRTVLAMTVNPAAGVISGQTFSDKVRYEFLIDMDGDARQDETIIVTFGKRRSDGRQTLRVRTLIGERTFFIAKGFTDETIEGRFGVRVWAGLRDDPFFFDLNSFNDGATFCQAGDSDFFQGLNVSAIVIDLPTGDTTQAGVWGRTLDKNQKQIDRMGRPAILTVFIPPNPFEPNDILLENAYNFGRPKNDQENYRAEVVDSLTLLYSLNDSAGDDPSDDAMKIAGLADFLLPDILTADLTQETAFPNGRNLADDVIDAELGLITEGLITSDCVDNNSAFLTEFPYLAEPN
jgi:hypothetical protein